jgi:hypothetical protein
MKNYFMTWGSKRKWATILIVLMLSGCFGGVQPCGTYNGHSLHKGPRGGCYYINSNNNKTYVDRSYCNC